jgi:hypothetical protein
VAPKRDAQRTLRKDDPEARHKAEMVRMRAVIAEITAENLQLKKGFEAQKLFPIIGGEEGGSNGDRRANQATMGGGEWIGHSPPWIAAQRLLPLEAGRLTPYGSRWKVGAERQDRDDGRFAAVAGSHQGDPKSRCVAGYVDWAI